MKPPRLMRCPDCEYRTTRPMHIYKHRKRHHMSGARRSFFGAGDVIYEKPGVIDRVRGWLRDK